MCHCAARRLREVEEIRSGSVQDGARRPSRRCRWPPALDRMLGEIEADASRGALRRTYGCKSRSVAHRRPRANRPRSVVTLAQTVRHALQPVAELD